MASKKQASQPTKKSKPGKNGATKKAHQHDAAPPKQSRAAKIGAAVAVAVLAVAAAAAGPLRGVLDDLGDLRGAAESLACAAAGAGCGGGGEPSCGVVVAPRAARWALRVAFRAAGGELLVVDPSRVGNASADELGLLRYGAVTRLAPGADSAAVDAALLALDAECARGRKWSAGSPRLEALRRVYAAAASKRGRAAAPVADDDLEALRASLRAVGADVDARGLWADEGFFASAADVPWGDTPLLRAARDCDARATRALLALGADAAATYDRRGYRALDLALRCESRSLFATAKEVVDGCGGACVNFGETTPPDGLNGLHRVLLKWASAYFPTRPAPSPWNSLAKMFVDAGGDLLEPTRTAARETPLHVAVGKRNLEGAAMLLDSAPDEDVRRAMLAARDGVGGFAPLAVAASWRNWAITVPRLLAASQNSAEPVDARLRTQALDGAPACAGSLPGYDERRAGYPLLATGDALADCGFLGNVVELLLNAGADPYLRDDANRTALHDLHPFLVPDGDARTDAPDARRARDALRKALGAGGAPLLAESRAARELWHADFGAATVGGAKLDGPGDGCDARVARGAALAELDGFVDAGAPALFAGALDGTWDGARREWANRTRLLETHGGAHVRAGAIPYASAFQSRETVASLRDALAAAAADSARALGQARAGAAADAPSYVFEQIRWDGRPGDHPFQNLLKDNVGALPLLDGGYAVHNAQFYAGDALSGAPAHYHAHALNALVRGRKRWLLFPPKHAAYSKLPAAAWLEKGRVEALRRAGVDVLVCTQPEDAALYVPSGWGHVVLNLETSVGVAMEFHKDGELTWSFEDRAADAVAADRRL